MGKNITVYISDELARKMEEFGEVNWSEIARQGIERYIEGRVTEAVIKNQVPNDVLNEFRFYLESLRWYLNSSYTYSIASMHNDFNVDVSPREKRQFFEIFDNLQEDFSELCQSFELFEQKKNIDEFEPVFVKLLRVIERYSKMVRDFTLLVKEKIDRIELIGQRPGSRAPHEYLDETYSNFREKYNNLVTNFVKFVFLTRDLHKQHIDDYRIYDLLAPKLVNFRLSAKKEKPE